jgi:Tfp pilus assembly protein PilF
MRYYAFIVSIISILTLGSVPAVAAGNASLTWDESYSMLLKDPTNRAVNQQYLELCLARQDYEAAIPPLERLLSQEPDNVGLILKLGEMYKRLGSEKVAQGYFATVLNHPQVTDELRAQATTLSRN